MFMRWLKVNGELSLIYSTCNIFPMPVLPSVPKHLLVLDGGVAHVVDPEFLAVSEVGSYTGLVLARNSYFHGFSD
jgi:hypothetical protein